MSLTHLSWISFVWIIAGSWGTPNEGSLRLEKIKVLISWMGIGLEFVVFFFHIPKLKPWFELEFEIYFFIQGMNFEFSNQLGALSYIFCPNGAQISLKLVQGLDQSANYWGNWFWNWFILRISAFGKLSKLDGPFGA